jgi:hypothetical protein
MSALEGAILLIVAIGLAPIGYVCLAKPRAVVEWHQRHYRPNFPTMRMVSKPWFPVYLRFMGIFIWAFAVLFALGAIGKLP